MMNDKILFYYSYLKILINLKNEVKDEEVIVEA